MSKAPWRRQVLTDKDWDAKVDALADHAPEVFAANAVRPAIGRTIARLPFRRVKDSLIDGLDALLSGRW